LFAGGVNWAGTYQVQGGCDTSSCCCPTGTLNIAQSGLLISVSTSVVGNCFASTWNFRFNLTSEIDNTASFSYGGVDYQAI
jgi:hypothetical protein